MAQLNSLIVTGNSRFINPINGDARNGVYYVKGTQTAATGAWTGVIPIPALYDGLTIMYYLPYAGSGNATLNLTLSNGTTTGAINCYYSTSRLTTHYAKGCNIVMTYHPAGSISVDGTATTDNRWIANANYDSNSDQNAMSIRYYNNVLAKEALTAEKIIVGGYDGYQVATSGITFNLSYPIIWTTAAVAKGSSNYANMYSQIYDRNLTNVKSGFASTANKAIYLIVTVSGLTATVDSNILTDTLPSTEDGKVYIYLGKLGAQSTGTNYFIFEPVHPMFWYYHGEVVPYDGTANLLLDMVYPVGSIYMSVNNVNPSTYLTGTTWEAWGAGRVPVGVDPNDVFFHKPENEGGEATVTLTAAQSGVPAHTHKTAPMWAASSGSGTHNVVTGYPTTSKAGSYDVIVEANTAQNASQAHNNLQPYITCYMWKRTA